MKAAPVLEALDALLAQGTGRFEYRRIVAMSDGQNSAGALEVADGKFDSNGLRSSLQRTFEVDDDINALFAEENGGDLNDIEINLVVDTDAVYFQSPLEDLEWTRVGLDLFDEEGLGQDLVGALPIVDILENLDPTDAAIRLEEKKIGGLAATGYRVLIPDTAAVHLIAGSLVMDPVGNETAFDLDVTVDVWVHEGELLAIFADLTDLWIEAARASLSGPELTMLGRISHHSSYTTDLVFRDLGLPITVEVPGAATDLADQVPGGVEWNDLTPGQCPISDDLVGDLAELLVFETTDCANEKRYQVFARFDLADYAHLLDDEDALDAAVQADCLAEAETQFGINLLDSVVELLYLIPVVGNDPVCMLDSPDRRSGDLLAPVPFSSPGRVEVLPPVRLEAERSQWVRHVLQTGDNTLVAIGTDDSNDPSLIGSEYPDTDLAIWNSLDGGHSWEQVAQPTFAGVPGTHLRQRRRGRS